MKSLSVVLFLGFALFVASSDVFQFDITFSCRFYDRATWHFKVDAYDDDVGSNDLIGSSEGDGLPGENKTSIVIKGTQDGDEMTSGGYRPLFEIYHTCTSDKKQVRLILTSQKLCRVGIKYPATCHYKVVKDITDTWGDEKIMPELKHDLDPF